MFPLKEVAWDIGRQAAYQGLFLCICLRECTLLCEVSSLRKHKSS